VKNLSFLLLLVFAGNAFGQASSKCADMTQFKAPGEPLVITKAAVLPAAEGMPARCQVDGMINEHKGPDGKTYGVGFAVALPDNWNNRYLFQGGGLYNGLVRPPVGAAAAGGMTALARGFAVASSDTGHEGTGRSYDVDQQASLDFAQVAVAQVTRIAKQIVARYYGQDAKYSYFTGCSTGGREGMLMTQRYPTYYDGVISGDPAMRTGFSGLGNTWRRVMFNQAAPKDAAGKPQPNKLFSESDKKLLVSSMLNSCDALDGLKDGMVFNPEACKFDPAELVCKGAKTDSCLSQPQVSALQKAFPGPKTAKGDIVYQMSLYDADVLSLFPSAEPPRDPAALETTLDLEERLYELATNPLEAVTDSTWTNLTTFSAHGGKLMFYHGMADPTFHAMDTLNYYKKMAKENGGMAKVQDWSRFYLVPGMLHCRGGEAALDNFDLLSKLVDWVEKGEAPESVVATGTALPGRSRPLCPYPKHTQYMGKGDPQDAKNFVCQ
jgi:feruloyl esterase